MDNEDNEKTINNLLNTIDDMTITDDTEAGIDSIDLNLLNTSSNDDDDDENNNTINSYPQTHVFWRIIRWMVRDPSFKIDKNLIVAQVEDYDNWLTSSWFDEDENCKEFMCHLNVTLESECYSLSDVKQMLSVMNMLQFNSLFIELLNETQYVRHSLIDSISIVKNDNLSSAAIIKLFKEYQYPIAEQLFKMPSVVDQELQKIKLKKLFLSDEVGKKDERIQDLERQNDRLMKEVQYLQQLNRKNDSVKDLESQNSALLTELQILNDSKLKLAANANSTIDELRNYLVEYQKVVINANSGDSGDSL